MPETRINVDFIVEEYGRIYQQRGQGLNRIKRALIQKSETLEKYASPKRLTDDIYEMANDEFQPVLQPFRVAFEPKGGVKFHPNKILLQHIKVDVSFSPDTIIDNWLGFLEGDGVDRTKWPITKYMIEVYLKKQIDFDREMNAVYFGVRDDAGTTPSSCMDGIRKKLIEGASDEYPINIISGIGKLEPTICFDQVEYFSKKIKGIYRNVPIIICVSQDFERCFLENKRANGFYWIKGPEDLNANVDFTKQVVMGLPSMGDDCGDMFAFVKGNLMWCTRKDKFNFDIQKENRLVKILADWREGIGFGVNKMVWATDHTVGTSAVDTASPADGIIVRSIYPKVNAASGVDHEKATVKGSVLGELPEGTTVKVNYGTSTSLGTQSSALTADTKGVYTANLTSLSAETKYYYRLEVTIGTDKYVSETKDFTTEAAPAAGGAQ